MSAASRQSALRSRRHRAGLERVELWAKPADVAAIKEFAAGISATTPAPKQKTPP